MTDTTSERAVLEGVPTELYIDGQWRAATGGGTLAVEDPATGETLVEVADAPARGRARGARGGGRGQAEWAATAPRERGEILRRAYEALIARDRRAGAADDAGDG